MSSVSGSLGRKPVFEGGLSLMRPCFRQTHSIKTTVFGDPEKEIAWHLCERIGLIFEKGCDPLVFTENLLRKEGFRSHEELRKQFAIPPLLLACRTIGDTPADDFCSSTAAEPAAVLRQALILGLCGQSFYDPNKAVIWTKSRLLRKIDLYIPGRFYEDY